VKAFTKVIIDVTSFEIIDMVHDNIFLDVVDQGFDGLLLMTTKDGDKEDINKDYMSTM